MTRRTSPPNLQVNKTWTGDVVGVKGEQPNSLIAQQRPPLQQPSDQIAGETSSQPEFKPKVKPDFKELPEKPRFRGEQTSYEWESVTAAHRVGKFVLSVEATVTIRWNDRQLPEPQIWIIGFVQNVLGESLTYKFEGSEERTINRSVVLLDQTQEEGFDASNEPWISKRSHPIPGLTVFDNFDTSTRKKTIKLAMNDRPTVIYHHFRYGNDDLGQLETARSTRDFGLWILARPVDAPARDVRSYAIVYAGQWSITDGLKVIRGPGRPAHIALPEVEVLRQMRKPSLSPMERGRVPKLTGPIVRGYPWPEAREILAY